MRQRLKQILLQDRQIVNPESKAAAERPYLGLDQVESHTGRILLDDTANSEGGESTTFAFDDRHILYGKLRPYLNKVALPSFVGRCTTELIPFLPADHVDREFAAWLLRSPAVLSRACSQNNGSRMPRADLDHLLGLEAIVPDLPTQRRIAARLKEEMAGVEAARKAVEEQRQAVTPLFEKILSEAFGGITPLSLGINSDPAPPGWEWRRLLDVARLESGHTPSRRHPEYWENGDIPWLALPDIRALDCRVALATSEKTNALGIANSSARVLPANTVALSRTASVGFVTIFGCPMATSQDFVDWICGKEVHPTFLMWLLRAAREFIRDVSTGAIHKTVYMDVVERFHVCLPEPSVQASIASRLDEAFVQTESFRAGLGQQMEAVSALPGAYLREAFAAI